MIFVGLCTLPPQPETSLGRDGERKREGRKVGANDRQGKTDGDRFGKTDGNGYIHWGGRQEEEVMGSEGEGLKLRGRRRPITN